MIWWILGAVALALLSLVIWILMVPPPRCPYGDPSTWSNEADEIASIRRSAEALLSQPHDPRLASARLAAEALLRHPQDPNLPTPKWSDLPPAFHRAHMASGFALSEREKLVAIDFWQRGAWQCFLDAGEKSELQIPGSDAALILQAVVTELKELRAEVTEVTDQYELVDSTFMHMSSVKGRLGNVISCLTALLARTPGGGRP